jgi:GTPase
LIHVVDITHPAALAQWQSVKNTLEEIGAGKIPTITAINKIDAPYDPVTLEVGLSRFGNAVTISAKTGKGLIDLTAAVEKHLFETYVPISVKLPYTQGNLISLFHEQGQVDQIEHGRGSVLIKGSIPGRLLVSFQPFLNKAKESVEEEI